VPEGAGAGGECPTKKCLVGKRHQQGPLQEGVRGATPGTALAPRFSAVLPRCPELAGGAGSTKAV